MPLKKVKISKTNECGKWKAVKIEGCIDGDGLEGFAGLEILENYDPKILFDNAAKRNKNYLSNDLDDEAFDIRNDVGVSDSESNEEEERPPKKKIRASNHYPGKYVLLNARNFFADEESAAIRETWEKSGITSDNIIRSLVELNFSTPTSIQQLVIPMAIKNSPFYDILGAAPTGSGKTLAFALPIVQSIEKEIESDENVSEKLFSLILTPTRELAQQIHKHLTQISKYTNVSIACIIGGLSTEKQERILKAKPNVVIATTGRLWELVQDRNEHLQQLPSIKYLVVDETDRMIEKGHFAELENILEFINSNAGNSKMQTFVFSATLTLTHELPSYVKKQKKRNVSNCNAATPEERANVFISIFKMKNPKVFDITSQHSVAKNIVESKIMCSLNEKDYFLYYILLTGLERTIVFCNSIECVKRNASVLSHLNLNVVMLHGQMVQKQRLKNLDKFQENPNVIMIATNCAARGLDIPNIEHVIHYQVPLTGEDYVHRSGRTARADKEGLSVLIMEPNEVKNYVKLQRTLKRNEDLPTFVINDSNLMAIVRKRVNLAREVENIDFKIRKLQENNKWNQRASEMGTRDFTRDSDDSDNEEPANNSNIKKLNMFLKQKKFELEKLLASNIFSSSQFSSLKFPINGLNMNIKHTSLLDSMKAKIIQNTSKRIRLFQKK